MRPKVFWSIFFFTTLLSHEPLSQTISSNSVISTHELVRYLRENVREELNNAEEASLAMYFREKFSERYFYDYRTFSGRLLHYNKVFKNQEDHKNRALDHLMKYSDSTQWVLPFNYLSGDPVDAYALRHLARQHKMVDIALHYFNDKKDPDLIRYFVNQMKSLNAALHAGEYETIEDGNGVYEAFRSGYRILNWLWIHNMFLNEQEYSDKDQLTTIATLLQHGQHLYERNNKFKFGNHQTRGVSALAMLAILLRDFVGTDLWLERAMLRLGEHLDREINDDGFQFERSVHYHMSDINNYFYVYQLAKLNSIQVPKEWEERLRGLFTTLVKVAYPDRSAPVLQDDTEIPWAEKNDISGAMTLGYLLFEDPEFGYFASNTVDDRVYWFLSDEQVQLLEKVDRKRPTYGSLAFNDTHYYIMREGWQPDDKMMIISAGLDPNKPDHQHGDMLGIQAMANGHAILPNYQVRYSLEDFELFKNSMVKNVALVDDQLQGKKWTSNKGGSGFGKFGELPNPEVIAWESNNDFDLFVGRHDGFKDIGVDYSRQVIYVKDEFWIVKDNFYSDQPHEYKQVWQGHYTHENGPDLIRATMPDISGYDILQLNATDTVFSSGSRGKQWSVVSRLNQKNFSFITIIYPYKGYNNRINEGAVGRTLNDWDLNKFNGYSTGKDPVGISSENVSYLFNVKELKRNNQKILFDEEADVIIIDNENQRLIYSIGIKDLSVTITTDGQIKSVVLKAGEHLIFKN